MQQGRFGEAGLYLRSGRDHVGSIVGPIETPQAKVSNIGSPSTKLESDGYDARVGLDHWVGILSTAIQDEKPPYSLESRPSGLRPLLPGRAAFLPTALRVGDRRRASDHSTSLHVFSLLNYSRIARQPSARRPTKQR